MKWEVRPYSKLLSMPKKTADDSNGSLVLEGMNV